MTSVWTVTISDPDGVHADQDIGEFVKSIDKTGGIEDALGTIANIGQIAITLDNSLRYFSPRNTSSPFYDVLKPSAFIDIQWDGFQFFRGRVKLISPVATPFASNECVLEAEDILGDLSRVQISLPIQFDLRADQLIKLITARAFKTGLSKGQVRYKTSSAVAIADNDTVTIDGTQYRFKNTPTQANDVKISADRVVQIAYLSDAINGTSNPDGRYFLGTTRPSHVTARIKPDTLSQWIRSRNPIRYYRFAETAGTTVVDLGENGRNGLYGGSPVLNAVNSPIIAEEDLRCTTFDGVDDVATIPSLDLSNRSFAMHIMINPSASSPPAQQTFISTWNGSNIFNVRLYSTGQLQVVNGGTTIASATGAITFGAWQRIVISYNYTTGVTSVWRDGTLLASGTGTGLTQIPTVFDIGRAVFLSEYFKGNLAEFALFFRTDITGFTLPTTPPGLFLEANTEGAWANGKVVSTTSAALEVEDFSGGTDYADQDIQASVNTFDVAADKWSSSQTTALSALRDVLDSERGLLWVDEYNEIVFKNRFWIDTQTIFSPQMSSIGDANIVETGFTQDDIFNRVIIDYQPRSTTALGVIAKAEQSVKSIGRWGAENRPPELERVNHTASLPPNGITTVTLPFNDLSNGTTTGARNIVLPLEPGVDFTANEAEDGSGVDYTNYAGLKFYVAITGSGVEITIENQALGVLYIKDLQVRGEAIVSFSSLQYESRDDTSINRHGTRALQINLPLGGDPEFAKSLADLYVGRYAQPLDRLKTISFFGTDVVDAIFLPTIEIGTVIDVTDDQLELNAAERYIITGRTVAWSKYNGFTHQFFLRPIEDETYWVLEDATFGVLGTSTRLGV